MIGRQVAAFRLIQQPLGQFDRMGIAAANRRAQRQRLRDRLARRHQSADQPQAQCLGRLQCPPRKDDLGRACPPQLPGQEPGRPAIGHQPEIQERRTEPRIVGSEDHVAGHRQAPGHAIGAALHRRHGRDRQRAQPADDPLPHLQPSGEPQRSLAPRRRQLHVAAIAEIAFCPAEQQHPRRRRIFQPVKRSGKLLPHGEGDGVLRTRPVEGDDGHAIRAQLEQQFGVFARRAHLTLPC